jgi:hypothetical protein
MSEVAVVALMAHAYPNIDVPRAIGDSYFIRDHELADGLNKGLVRLWMSGDAVPVATGFREMPTMVVENWDGDQATGSNAWIAFEGTFITGDEVHVNGMKWMPDPENVGEYIAVDWGFMIPVEGDAVAVAALVAAPVASQEGINSEAMDNKVRCFSSLVADGGTSIGFSLRRIGGYDPVAIASPTKLRYAGWPDWPNTENQYEEPEVVPPAGTGGGQTTPPTAPAPQTLGLDVDGDGVVDERYVRTS